MRGVVWREDELHGLCNACRQYWPLTPEFWMPNNGVARCRACIYEGRSYQPPRKRILTAAERAYHREYNREWMRRYRRDQRRRLQVAA